MIIFSIHRQIYIILSLFLPLSLSLSPSTPAIEILISLNAEYQILLFALCEFVGITNLQNNTSNEIMEKFSEFLAEWSNIY